MGLLTALLAGFFWWLLGFRLWRSRRRRACETAGPLLLAVKAPRSLVITARIARAFAGLSALAVLVAVGWVFPAMLERLPFPIPTRAVFLWDIYAGFLLAGLLTVVVPMGRHAFLIEIREFGILRGFAMAAFTPWNEISEVRWFSVRRVFGVCLCWGIPRLCVHSRLTIVEHRIAPEQKETMTAVLGRFVPVFDHDGTLLATPAQAGERTIVRSSWWARNRWRFQYDLQSLLLLAVVVSCLASCYGIHNRRLLPERQAIAHFASLGAQITDLWGTPLAIDFSMCPTKPTDADMVYFEPFEKLWMLDLSGAPITDAGIEHLKRFRRLGSVDLTDTAVTTKGAEELGRALPQADIFYGPRKKPLAAGAARRR